MREQLRDDILRFLYEQHRTNPNRYPGYAEIEKYLRSRPGYVEAGVFIRVKHTMGQGEGEGEEFEQTALSWELRTMERDGLVKLLVDSFAGPAGVEITLKGVQRAERL